MFKVSIQLTDSLKNLLKETAKQLKGVVKRKFVAQTVAALGHGGQLKAEQELGWNRVTISKGIKKWFFITCYAKNVYKLAHIPCWVRKTAFNFDVLAFGKKSRLQLPETLDFKGEFLILV